MTCVNDRDPQAIVKISNDDEVSFRSFSCSYENVAL